MYFVSSVDRLLWPWQWSRVTSVISPSQCWLRVEQSPSKRVSLSLTSHMRLLPLCLSIVSTKLRFILPPKVNPLTFTPVSCCSFQSKWNTADCWPEQTEVTVYDGSHRSSQLDLFSRIFSRTTSFTFSRLFMGFFAYLLLDIPVFTGHSCIAMMYFSTCINWNMMVYVMK